MKVTMTDDELRAGIGHVLDNAALESLSAKIDEELWPELSIAITRLRVRSLTDCLLDLAKKMEEVRNGER